MGETPQATAARKLEEEVGIVIPKELLVGEQVVTYFHPGRQNVSITYMRQVSERPYVELNGDHSEYDWVGIGSLPSPMWPTTIEQIRWAWERTK